MIWLGRIPIRWRLSLWYMTLTALVLVIFSVAVYIGLERRLSENLDDDLRSQASLAAASITASGDTAVLDPTFRKQLSDEVLLWVLDFKGSLVLPVRGEQLGTIPVRKASISRAFYGLTTYDTIHAGGQHLRTITVPVRNDAGTPAYALQLGYSTSRIEDALELLIQALLVIAPLAIIVAALTGYLLAGRALQPVADITRLASQIDGDDLESRLNLNLPNDELGRLARTFDSMLDRIDLAFQRQRQFTGDAAHELRTPLSLMRSQIDLAVTQADTPEEFREALTALDGDVSRMTTLVGMLLSLARADVGQLTPNREPVDVADLALDVVDQLEPIAAENGLTIATNLSPVTASVDADMIIQVLVNLIDNAITNTPAGGTITVSVMSGQWSVVSGPSSAPMTDNGKQKAQLTPDHQPLATITVTDTGVGIAPEHLPRIFDRFYRVDTGRARSRGGIGLGLAISQAIVHAHHGSLTATSEPGKGSTFTLTLPIDDGRRAGEEANRRAAGLRADGGRLRERV
jgi:signal transduction histidine kinase